MGVAANNGMRLSLLGTGQELIIGWIGGNRIGDPVHIDRRDIGENILMEEALYLHFLQAEFGVGQDSS